MRARIIIATALLVVPVLASAKISKSSREKIETHYQPAVMHKGLLTAQEPMEPQKLRGFVVLERDGIPADKAYWFITNQEYEYRPVILEGDSVSTRRGKTYTFLKRGQLMAITGVEYSGNTVYLKLLSVENVVREGKKEKFPSRVTTMIGFKFSKDVAEGEGDTLIQTMESWLKPFTERSSAEAYAHSITGASVAPPNRQSLLGPPLTGAVRLVVYFRTVVFALLTL